MSEMAPVALQIRQSDQLNWYVTNPDQPAAAQHVPVQVAAAAARVHRLTVRLYQTLLATFAVAGGALAGVVYASVAHTAIVAWSGAGLVVLGLAAWWTRPPAADTSAVVSVDSDVARPVRDGVTVPQLTAASAAGYGSDAHRALWDVAVLGARRIELDDAVTTWKRAGTTGPAQQAATAQLVEVSAAHADTVRRFDDLTSSRAVIANAEAFLTTNRTDAA